MARLISAERNGMATVQHVVLRTTQPQVHIDNMTLLLLIKQLISCHLSGLRAIIRII